MAPNKGSQITELALGWGRGHTYTHTHIYIYYNIYLKDTQSNLICTNILYSVSSTGSTPLHKTQERLLQQPTEPNDVQPSVQTKNYNY